MAKKKAAKGTPAMKLAEFRLDALQGAEYNPRTISDEALAGLTKSIERFGCVEPIVVNIRGGRKRIVGGHQRARAMLAMGQTTATCVTISCTDAEEKLLNIALNNPAIQGQFTDALGVLIAELQAEIGDAALLDLRINELSETVATAEMPPLPDGDKSPYQQMTFTLHDSQAEIVKRAIDAAKQAGPFGDSPNENSNGNALARVAEAYIG